MDLDEKKILELFLGLVLVVFLVLIILIIVYLPNSNSGKIPTSSNVISNSYNTNYYNYYFENKNFYEKNYKDFEYELRYSSSGNHEKVRTPFNNYKDEFRVYVVNKDFSGGYFKVQFNFCDYENNCFSRMIEKYISSKQEKVFVYVDVQNEKYKYYNWDYEIFAEKGI